MEEDKVIELTIYFEDLSLVRAEFFYYKHIAKLKNNEIEKRQDKRSKTVGGYVSRSNKDFEKLDLDPTDPEVHHEFRRIAPGEPHYSQWPPEGYEPIERPTPPVEPPQAILPQVEPPVEPPVEPIVPPEPPIEPPIKPPVQPIVPPEPPIELVPPAVPEPQPRRFGWVAIVLGGVIVLVVFAVITALIVNWVQTRAVNQVAGIGTDTPKPTETDIPTETPIPTDTVPPTATEDRTETVAAVMALTAAALPTPDLVATDVKATSDYLTSIAPTETPTFTPTPTDTPLPTDTPTITPTPTPSFPLPFIDDFSDGIDTLVWRVVEGAAAIDDGWLKGAGDRVSLLIGDDSLDRYAIEFDYSDLRSYFNYLTWGNELQYRFHSNATWWQAVTNGNWSDISQSEGISKSGTIRFVVDGNHYQVYINGILVDEIIFGDPYSGPIRISLYPSTRISNFSITALD